MKIKTKNFAPTEIAKGSRFIQTVAATDKENVILKSSTSKDLERTKDADLLPLQDTVTKDCKSTQTGLKEITADDLFGDDSPSENYWEVLAQTRQEALEKSLIENEDLKLENSQLRIENDVLKSENKSLREEIEQNKEVIENAAHLADIINEIVKEREQNASTTDENDGDDNESSTAAD